MSQLGATRTLPDTSSRWHSASTRHRVRSSPIVPGRYEPSSTSSYRERFTKHRAVREQPDRRRPQPPEGAVTSDARLETRSDRERDHSWSRVDAEHSARPLRTRCRRPPASPRRGRVHRTRSHDLTQRPQYWSPHALLSHTTQQSRRTEDVRVDPDGLSLQRRAVPRRCRGPRRGARRDRDRRPGCCR